MANLDESAITVEEIVERIDNWDGVNRAELGVFMRYIKSHLVTDQPDHNAVRAACEALLEYHLPDFHRARVYHYHALTAPADVEDRLWKAAYFIDRAAAQSTEEDRDDIKAWSDHIRRTQGLLEPVDSEQDLTEIESRAPPTGAAKGEPSTSVPEQVRSGKDVEAKGEQSHGISSAGLPAPAPDSRKDEGKVQTWRTKLGTQLKKVITKSRTKLEDWIAGHGEGHGHECGSSEAERSVRVNGDAVEGVSGTGGDDGLETSEQTTREVEWKLQLKQQGPRGKSRRFGCGLTFTLYL